MSRGAPAATIPARLTVTELAEAIGVTPEAVRTILETRDEPGSPNDVIPGDLAMSVAAELGVVVVVEPRDLALEHLYELETRGEMGPSPGGRAGWISQGVAAGLDELDGMIEQVSEHWSVSRMPLIDRNVLRIALFELREDPETPTAVIVSEAVRLARTYSTERSGPFVNGVLATLAREVRG